MRPHPVQISTLDLHARSQRIGTSSNTPAVRQRMLRNVSELRIAVIDDDWFKRST